MQDALQSKLYTTAQVAERIGIKRNSISQLIWRIQGLRPARVVPPGSFLWTESEVERLVAYRNRRKKA